MEAIYQCTIFVAIALLAIVIAIFVFASSFYRGALELSIKEEERSFNRRKELIGKERTELGKKLKSADEGVLAKELRAELDKFDAELTAIDQSITTSRNKPKALAVRNMVTIPGSLLLASIVTSGIAITTSGTLSTIIWSISLLLLAVSVYSIYKNLSAVEFFSGIIDLSTLMEQALEKHAQKMLPIVEIEIWDFLLEIKRGQTEEIKYDISLKQGLIGRNTEVEFMGTEELEFPKEKTSPFGLSESSGMRNPKYFVHKLGDINPKIYRLTSFKVKAPDQQGEYIMSHWIKCDEYTGERTTFKIKVI